MIPDGIGINLYRWPFAKTRVVRVRRRGNSAFFRGFELKIVGNHYGIQHNILVEPGHSEDICSSAVGKDRYFLSMRIRDPNPGPVSVNSCEPCGPFPKAIINVKALIIKGG